MITDYATFAWLTDVFIVDEYRGKGFFDNPENFLTRPYGQMYTSGNFDELIFEFFKGEKKHKYH